MILLWWFGACDSAGKNDSYCCWPIQRVTDTVFSKTYLNILWFPLWESCRNTAQICCRNTSASFLPNSCPLAKWICSTAYQRNLARVKVCSYPSWQRHRTRCSLLSMAIWTILLLQVAFACWDAVPKQLWIKAASTPLLSVYICFMYETHVNRKEGGW